MDHRAVDSPSELERLAAELKDLERRVSALELKEKEAAPEAAFVGAFPLPKTDQQETAATQQASLVAILGRAILGMAGAYLLRAAAESGVVPKLVVVGAALVYAWGWLFLSVRAGKRSTMAGAAYGITSALILFPMLWEITARFQILPAFATAGILIGWLVCVLIIVRGAESGATIWATTFFASGTALGLLVATRNPLPFLVTLIVIAAITEFLGCREEWNGLGIIVAVPLDLGLGALLYLATLPGGFPAEYKAVSIPVTLVLFTVPLLIAASGAGYRTIRLHKKVAFMDIAQTFVTFVFLLAAVLQLGGSAGGKTLGLFGLLAAVFCYLEAFRNKHILGDSRNFRFYSTYAGVLFLICSYLAIPSASLAPWLYFSAFLATALSARTRRTTLGFHGLAWLIAAQISSGLMMYAGNLFAGSTPMAMPRMAWAGVASAAICSFILFLPAWEVRGIHVLRCCSVADASFLLGAFAVSGIVAIIQSWHPVSAAWLALTRTVVICVVTLALAIIGSRWKRKDLVWAAYTAIGLGTLKLLLEDFRFGSKASFAMSLLAFGVLLAVIPRLVRGGRQERASVDSK